MLSSAPPSLFVCKNQPVQYAAIRATSALEPPPCAAVLLPSAALSQLKKTLHLCKKCFYKILLPHAKSASRGCKGFPNREFTLCNRQSPSPSKQ